MNKMKIIKFWIELEIGITKYMIHDIPVLLTVLLHVLEYREDEPSYSLNKPDFTIFTITLLVASFTSCLVMFLFR